MTPPATAAGAVLDGLSDDELVEHIDRRLGRRLHTMRPEGDDVNRLASRIHEIISDFVSCEDDGVPLMNQPLPPDDDSTD